MLKQLKQRHLTYYHFYNQEQRNFIEREYAEDNIYNKANLALTLPSISLTKINKRQ